MLQHWANHPRLKHLDLCSLTFHTFHLAQTGVLTCNMEVVDSNLLSAVCEVLKICGVALQEVDFWSCVEINTNLRAAANVFGERMESISVDYYIMWLNCEQLTDDTMCHVVDCCPNLRMLELKESAALTDSFLLHATQFHLEQLIWLHLECSAHVTDAGVTALLEVLKHNKMEQLSFRNCILLTDVTLLAYAALFNAHQHDTICLSVVGTQVKKETVLQLIVEGKMLMTREIDYHYHDAAWIRDELNAAKLSNPQQLAHLGNIVLL